MIASLLGVSFSAKIDALNFRASVAPDLAKRHFGHAFGARGFPLHDPTRKEIKQLADYPLCYLEVAVDVSPPGHLLGVERRRELERAYELITNHIYPWNGFGITPGAGRVYDGRRTYGLDNRKPRFVSQDGRHGTVYFGHLSDPAQFKVYVKVIDQGSQLPESDRVIRLEVVLREAALGHFGLYKVGDLIGFNYRTKLRDYFHTIKPMPVGGRVLSPLYRTDRKVWKVVDRAKRHVGQRMIDEKLDRAGACSLHDLDNAVTNARAGFEPLNRQIRRSLATLP